MKFTTLTELGDHLGVSKRVAAEAYVNPLRLLVSDEFNRNLPVGGKGLHYHTRAINRAISAKVDFDSEINSLVELANRVITITCPVCKRKMQSGNAGGNQNGMCISYRCKCGIQLFLALKDDAIRVAFPEDKEK